MSPATRARRIVSIALPPPESLGDAAIIDGSHALDMTGHQLDLGSRPTSPSQAVVEEIKLLIQSRARSVANSLTVSAIHVSDTLSFYSVLKYREAGTRTDALGLSHLPRRQPDIVIDWGGKERHMQHPFGES
jgi:hypothetical protein